MKKFLIIIIVIVVLGALGAGAYFWLYGSKAPSEPTATNTQTGSPFGTTPADVTPSTGGNTGNTSPFSNGTTASGGPVASLFKIAQDPVAGAVIFLRNKDEIIRYVDRATGHIFEVNPATVTKTEIVNNTSPKIYNALWKPDGSTVLVQTLRDNSDTIVNTSLVLTPPKSTSTDALYTMSATELRGNVKTITSSATGLAFVLGDTGAVVTSGFGGEKQQTLYSSAFTNWQLVPQGSNLALTTNAVSQADGFAYLLSKSGSFTKLLGPLTALTTLIHPDGTRIAYSYTDGGTPTFAVKDLKTKDAMSIIPVTLAEKCVWSLKQKTSIICGTPIGGVGANQPENWYQGLTHYSDNIWKFNTDNQTASILAEPKKKFGVDLDVVSPQLSPNEDYLIFINKTDLSLWALKIGA